MIKKDKPPKKRKRKKKIKRDEITEYEYKKPEYELGDLGFTPEIKAKNDKFGRVVLKPQKATGSAASMRRAARMIKKLNRKNK
tara:strand:+ start:131 stop:379 length:249 start_codon:yes stop_codon:yes gene_type:complete